MSSGLDYQEQEMKFNLRAFLTTIFTSKRDPCEGVDFSEENARQESMEASMRRLDEEDERAEQAMIGSMPGDYDPFADD